MVTQSCGKVKRLLDRGLVQRLPAISRQSGDTKSEDTIRIEIPISRNGARVTAVPQSEGKRRKRLGSGPIAIQWVCPQLIDSQRGTKPWTIIL